MSELLGQRRGPEAALGADPVGEAAARRALREQIARLESELGALVTLAFPDPLPGNGAGSRAGPRLLSLGELEALRDELAARVGDAREALAARWEEQERRRLRLEAMLAEPAAHRWARVSNRDIGEPGCKEHRVVPRLGPLGLLLGWWRVKVSSGCPLAVAA